MNLKDHIEISKVKYEIFSKASETIFNDPDFEDNAIFKQFQDFIFTQKYDEVLYVQLQFLKDKINEFQNIIIHKMMSGL